MCGIAGFIGFENKVDLANKSNIIQKHRGPDNQSIWFDEHIALSHQRLSIIDLNEGANQPLIKGDWLIIFNGEIYNYKEIKSYLIQKYDSKFQTNSDTEVILESFIQEGIECLNKLLGMFSFCLYNKKTNETFLVRDHFGIKPMFYTVINGNVAFASELKTLTQIEGFDKNINIKSLVSSLNYLWVPGNESMFEGTFKLPPGHYLRIQADLKIETIKYWELTETNNIINDSSLAISGLDEVLQASIRRHLVSDVPVSSFLSGGLDSSLIAVLASKYNESLSTYTAFSSLKDQKIEAMPSDEKFARQISKLYNFNHNEILLDSSISSYLPQIVKTLDEPIGDPAAIITYMICDAARQAGVKVLLSGMGADEILFGYRRQKATLIAANYKRLPNIFRTTIEFIINRVPVKIGSIGLTPIRWAKRFIRFASDHIDKSYMMSYSYYTSDELKKLFIEDISGPLDKMNNDHRTIFNSKFKGDIINQMCNTDIQMFMNGLNLSYTDRASMAASVEVRVPFIDKEFVEYAMSINGNLKFKDRQSKYLLKKVAEKYLPHEVIYRPKASFGAPIRSWISNELSPLVDELLSKENINKRGLFNYDYVKKMIDNDRNGTEDNAYQIYQLLTTEIWFREYVD